MLNVSTSMGFEKYDILRSTAKNILKNNGASTEKAAEVLKQTLLGETENAIQAQSSVLKASTQITLNNSLKETLKYLKAHANDKRKEPKFGELWEILGTTNDSSEKNPYNDELVNFEISKGIVNIFAA